MKKVTVFSWCVLIMLFLTAPGQTSRSGCLAGRYMVRDPARYSYCMRCPDGTFIPDKFHERQNCIPCSQVKDTTTEEIETKCNRTHNAVIVCKKGYHRNFTTEKCQGACGKDTYYNISADDCLRCPTGSYLDREHHALTSCQTIEETTEASMMFCGKDQYLHASGVCQLCPPGTFQTVSEHLERTCQNCSTKLKPLPDRCTVITYPTPSDNGKVHWPILIALIVSVVLGGISVIAILNCRRCRMCTRRQTRHRDIAMLSTPDERAPMQKVPVADKRYV